MSDDTEMPITRSEHPPTGTAPHRYYLNGKLWEITDESHCKRVLFITADRIRELEADLAIAADDMTTVLRVIRREMTITAEDGAPTLTPRRTFIAITEGEARTLRRLLGEDTDNE